MNNEIIVILNLYAAGVTLLSDKRIFIFFFEGKKYSPGVTGVFRSCSQVTRNLQPDTVFRMFSIGSPTVRLKKDYLGSEARKISKTCCHSGKKSTPELYFFIIVLYHAQVSPIPYKSSENMLETVETRKTSKKHEFFVKNQGKP